MTDVTDDTAGVLAQAIRQLGQATDIANMLAYRAVLQRKVDDVNPNIPGGHLEGRKRNETLIEKLDAGLQQRLLPSL